MLKDILRHTLEGILRVMEAAVKLSRRAKIIEKNCSTPGLWPPASIYNRAYPEMLASASPGNHMDVKKPSLLLLFVQQDEKYLEELTCLEEPYVLTTFGKK